MRKRERRFTQEEEALLRELEQYEENGCMICLNGRPSMPERVVSACLRENGGYMRDFVSDEEKHIQKINFVRIREKR